MASASALPSARVKPPSISTASLAPEITTGARKNPRSPAGKCFHASWTFATIALVTPRAPSRTARGGGHGNHIFSGRLDSCVLLTKSYFGAESSELRHDLVRSKLVDKSRR